MNAPVLITVQRGKPLRLELLNLFARNAVGDRDLAGKTVSEVFPELDQWVHKIATVVQSGRPYVGVDEPVTFDWSGTGKTETRYLTLVCQPLLGADRTIDGSVLFAIDVTKSVVERACDPRSRKWLEAALDCVVTPIVLAEPETGRVVFENEAAHRLSHGAPTNGTTFSQAIGLDTGYFCTDAEGARIPVDRMPAARAARGEAVDAVELMWHTPSGSIPLVCFAELVPATQGLPSVVVLSFFDASRAKRLERELQDAVSARDAFLALASHELRTPLTALKLQIQSLMRKSPDTHGFAAIERATKRMDALIEQMLEAVRIRETGVQLAPEDQNLCAIVDDLIDRLRSESERVGSPLSRVGAPAVHGRWDRSRLERVFSCLLGNALRFGAGAAICVDCQDLGNRALVAVTDGGIGIEPADHERIFEQFGRAVPSKNFGGLGQGLWITREIVTQMGGSISVRSAPGNGSTFIVELPKSPARTVGPQRPHDQSHGDIDDFDETTHVA